jgi:rhodanese-related sulfurtransferase
MQVNAEITLDQLEDQVIIDVRERDEFEAEHVPSAINVPLSSFAVAAPGVLSHLDSRNICFMCHSGVRAQRAWDQAQGFGYDRARFYKVCPGGIRQWKQAGRPLVTRSDRKRAPLSLMRQTQIAMGALVIVFAALGLWVHPGFSGLAAGMGVGMMLAGITGNCAMANAVAKLPWNRV